MGFEDPDEEKPEQFTSKQKQEIKDEILNWQKITQDTYVLPVDLTVQATDNNGAAAVSQPVRITTRKQTAN